MLSVKVGGDTSRECSARNNPSRSMMEGGGLGDVEYDPDEDGEDEQDVGTKESQRNQKPQHVRRRKFGGRDSLDKIVHSNNMRHATLGRNRL